MKDFHFVKMLTFKTKSVYATMLFIDDLGRLLWG